MDRDGRAVRLRASVAFRSSGIVYGPPLSEDGYLSLTIARNIAAGHGVTADGRELTNGFQPLWVFATAVWFKLFHGDRLRAVRAVLLTHSVIFFLSAHVWARFLSAFASARREHLYILFAATYLTCHQLLLQSFNGLETGLLLLTAGLAVGSYVDSADGTPWKRLRTGCLLACLTLVRIDAAIFVAILVAIDFMAIGGADPHEAAAGRYPRRIPALFPAARLAHGWLQFGSLMTQRAVADVEPIGQRCAAQMLTWRRVDPELLPTLLGRPIPAALRSGVFGSVDDGMGSRARIAACLREATWKEPDGRTLRSASPPSPHRVQACWPWFTRAIRTPCISGLAIGARGDPWRRPDSTRDGARGNGSPRFGAPHVGRARLPSLLFVPAPGMVWTGQFPCISGGVLFERAAVEQVDLVRRYSKPGEHVGARSQARWASSSTARTTWTVR
jgi:hypothetical protein